MSFTGIPWQCTEDHCGRVPAKQNRVNYCRIFTTIKPFVLKYGYTRFNDSFGKAEFENAQPRELMSQTNQDEPQTGDFQPAGPESSRTTESERIAGKNGDNEAIAPTAADFADEVVETWDDEDPVDDAPPVALIAEIQPPCPEVRDPAGADEDNSFRGISSFLQASFENSAVDPDDTQPVETPPDCILDCPDATATATSPVEPMQAPPLIPDDACNPGLDREPADAPEAGLAADPVPAAEPPIETPAEPQLGPSDDTVPDEDARTTAPEATPFFPIPDMLPDLPPEDTKELPRGGSRRRRNKRSAVGVLFNIFSWLVLVAFFLAIGLALVYYRYGSDRLYNNQFESSRTVILTVNPGDRLSHILARMRDERLLSSYMAIDDAYLMRYLAWINDNSSKIKSGAYKLNASMSLSEIYNRLIEGSQDFKVTIPEGKTVREVAAIVKKKNDAFDEERFIELTRDPAFIGQLGLQVPSLEGYLYPSTYFFGPGMKEEDLVKMMVKTFKETVQAGFEGVTKSDDLSFHDHVVMASLIEREARKESDRPLIASVIFNRLKKDMKLDIDATVNYALNEWSRPLTFEDLKIEHPYNTYLRKGLPPGPICNPQISSLLATFRPEKSEYLYYVYKGDDTHAFARTYEEHLANIRLYRKGRDNAGPDRNGKSANASSPATGSAESGTSATGNGQSRDSESSASAATKTTAERTPATKQSSASARGQGSRNRSAVANSSRAGGKSATRKSSQ
jgi:UPF0755 protein